MLGCPPPTIISSTFPLYSSIHFPLSTPFPSTPPHFLPFLSILQYLSLYLLHFLLLHLTFLSSSFRLYSSIPVPLSIPFPSTPPHVPFFFLSSLFFNTFPSIYSFSFYSTSPCISSSFPLYSSIPFPLSTPVHSTPPHVPFFFLSSLFFNTFPSIYYFPFYSTSPCISSVLNSFCFIWFYINLTCIYRCKRAFSFKQKWIERSWLN